LIAECSLVCRQPCSTPFGPLLALYRTAALVPKFAIHIIPIPPSLISIPNFYFYSK
jgi:hypothetical protein